MFTVAWSWTATITLRSTFLTEGSDEAYANLYPRVRSGVLLREAPAFRRGESSQPEIAYVFLNKNCTQDSINEETARHDKGQR